MVIRNQPPYDEALVVGLIKAAASEAGGGPWAANSRPSSRVFLPSVDYCRLVRQTRLARVSRSFDLLKSEADSLGADLIAAGDDLN